MYYICNWIHDTTLFSNDWFPKIILLANISNNETNNGKKDINITK